MYSPVALFTYNRPSHTQNVLNALAECHGMHETRLFVFSDGLKGDGGEEEAAQIRTLRKLLHGERRFSYMQIVEREENLGLGRSIIDGVSHVIREYGRVIVLEDDLVVHPDFLLYMNFYLDNYAENRRIFHVCGFQKESWLQFFLPRAYCTHFMNCSGWATWADRWHELELDIGVIDEYLRKPGNLKAFNYHVLDMSDQFSLNRNGLRTWAIFWYATIQMRRGLCINPRFSFVWNIGDDGSGTNMGSTEKNRVRNPAKRFRPSFPEVKESVLSRIHVREAYGRKSRLRANRLKGKLFSILTTLRNQFLFSGL